MTDDDLIRRGDALAAVQGSEYCCNAEEDIAAIPAVTVGVYECAGCGRLCRDPEADLATLRDKGAISCCPERHMEPVAAPDPAAIREAALREALDCCTDYGFTRADECRDAILALIQKGGDACDKDDDPTNARPATSPGVTAGADAAHARETAMQELIDAYEDIMDYGIVLAKKAQQDRLKAAKARL